MAQSSLPECTGDEQLWTACQGKFIRADGSKQVGEFKNGTLHGQGVLISADGSTFAGEFKEGYLNGQGTINKANGDKYVGEIRDNTISGIGTYTYANGDRYYGEWQNKYIGQVNITFANGDKYVGELKDKKPHGYGKYTYSNGDTHVGEWKDHLPSGYGTYTRADGRKEVGEFKGHLIHGRGIEFGVDGRVFRSGIYEAGMLISAQFIDPASFTQRKQDLHVQAVNAQIIENGRIKAEAEPVSNAERQPPNAGGANDERFSELDRLRTAAEQAKREKAELEAQLAVAQQQAQVKPAAQIAPQGKRVALVIGNAKYKFSPLNNPVNDATDMAASLRSVGFDVIEIRDANKLQMRAATRRFEDKLAASDVGLVYYSGHGVEVKGRNYLIPVDADIRREHEVEDQAFDAGNILRMMESLQGTEKNRVNIMIVDACRNNDLARSWRSTNRGLARMDAPTGSFISFATAPGQVASDGNGRNSPFTKHLLQALKQPNVPIEQVFKEVRRNVMDETGGEQVPWENSSLIGDFYFTVAR